jgi:hypothetical protein
VSNIVIQVNGSSAGDGFLLAPENGITFTVSPGVRVELFRDLRRNPQRGRPAAQYSDGNVPHPRRHQPPDHDLFPHHEVTGKVSAIAFDHLGDFEGFTVETGPREFRRFRSREPWTREIVREAMEDRGWVTVLHEPHRRDEVSAILVRVPPHERELKKEIGRRQMQAELERILGRFGADTGTIHLTKEGILVLKANAGLPPQVVEIAMQPPSEGWNPRMLVTAAYSVESI